MTKDKALDLALEALEHMLEDAKQERLTVEYWNECVDAITAIKQARSAPVQEPVAIVDEDGVIVVCNYKYKPGDKLYTTPPAQPAPVQEPVAFNAGVPPLYPEMKDGETISVEYTTPPAQRQWVGLTDEAIWSEYQTLWPFHPAEEPGLAKDIAKFARAIEAKLKEKNT